MATAGVFTWSETETKSDKSPMEHHLEHALVHTSMSVASGAAYKPGSPWIAAVNGSLVSNLPIIQFHLQIANKFISSEKYLFGISWTLFHWAIWTF